MQKKLKSNKGFLFQDLAIAIFALLIFAGIVGSMYLAIYKVKAETQAQSIATVYAIQMVEYMDKINYDEITDDTKENLLSEMRQNFAIPEGYGITLDISPYNQEPPAQDDIMKNLKLKITYTINNEEKYLEIDRLKTKEQ